MIKPLLFFNTNVISLGLNPSWFSPSDQFFLMVTVDVNGVCIFVIPYCVFSVDVAAYPVTGVSVTVYVINL